MEIEAGTLRGLRESNYYKQDQGCIYLRLGRYGTQTGVGLPLLQCWVPLSVCFSFVLAWMGLAVARNKEAGPISYHIPGSSFNHFWCISFVIDHANYFNP